MTSGPILVHSVSFPATPAHSFAQVREVFSTSAPVLILFLRTFSIPTPFPIIALRALWTLGPILTRSIFFPTNPIFRIIIWRILSTCRPILIWSIFYFAISIRSVPHCWWIITHSCTSSITISGLIGSSGRTRGRGTRRDIPNAENTARGAHRRRVAIRRAVFFGIGIGGLMAHAEDAERVMDVRVRRMDGAVGLWWRNYMSSCLRPSNGLKIGPELTD